jgi:hypothetical protein
LFSEQWRPAREQKNSEQLRATAYVCPLPPGVRPLRGDAAADDAGQEQDARDAPAASRLRDQPRVRQRPPGGLFPPGGERHVRADGPPRHGSRPLLIGDPGRRRLGRPPAAPRTTSKGDATT